MAEGGAVDSGSSEIVLSQKIVIGKIPHEVELTKDYIRWKRADGKGDATKSQ